MPSQPVLYAREPNAALALTCAKFTHAGSLDWYLVDGDDPAQEPLDEEWVIQALKDADLVEEHPRWGTLGLTDLGRETGMDATAEMLCGPQDTPEDRAEAALWHWLLMRGGTQGSYGSTDRWGRNGEIGHLLLCGLSLSFGGGVRDDRWTTWTGSFSDDRDVAGVGGYAHCQCGTIAGLHITHEVESITALLRQALNLPA